MVGATRSRELFMNRFKLRTDMVAMWESVLAGCERASCSGGSLRITPPKDQ